MAKVGLKDTLALLAKGYSKKEIDALAAIDEEQEKDTPAPEPAPEPAPVPEPVPDVKEPDPEVEELKKQLNETMEKLKAAEEKTRKIQQDNVHTDSAPAAEQARAQQEDALLNLVRGFM